MCVVVLGEHLRGTGVTPEGFRCDLAEGAKVEEEPSRRTHFAVLFFVLILSAVAEDSTRRWTNVHQRIQVEKCRFCSTLAVLMA